MKRFKRFLIWSGTLLILVVLLFLFRVPIMKSFGHWLIVEDPLQKAEVLFVLSGGPLDRGNEAVRIFNEGYVPRIICTGENIPHNFKAIGVTYLESEVTRIHMNNEGVPMEKIGLIKKGTSTFEEAEEIITYCQKNQIKKVMVLSSKFHTRRINKVLREQFEEADIEFILRGAPSSAYDEERWWESESGLINLNNEYIKIFYYWYKY